MHQHEGNDKEQHGGMNHGIGMMLVSCVVPMAAVWMLPSLGVSRQIAIYIGVGGMIALHGGMMAIQALKKRKAKRIADPMHAPQERLMRMNPVATDDRLRENQ
jgi:hypothetical protein